MRIIRVSIYHEGTFRAILRTALRGLGCFPHGGRLWAPLESGRGYAIYRQGPDCLDWLQQRVDDYEQFFYTRLLHGHCGADGILRPHTQLHRAGGRAYRRCEEATGDLP